MPKQTIYVISSSIIICWFVTMIMNNILLAIFIITRTASLSSKVADTANLMYQTGVVTIVTGTTVSSTPTTFSISYVGAISTLSVNGSLGIISNFFTMDSNYGWKVFIPSLDNINMFIEVVTQDNTNSITYL